ncbi:MAG: hypothetical protein ACO3EZ_12645 [Prochlorotrichaceae cyanobacterium]
MFQHFGFEGPALIRIPKKLKEPFPYRTIANLHGGTEKDGMEAIVALSLGMGSDRDFKIFNLVC